MLSRVVLISSPPSTPDIIASPMLESVTLIDVTFLTVEWGGFHCILTFISGLTSTVCLSGVLSLIQAYTGLKGVEMLVLISEQ